MGAGGFIVAMFRAGDAGRTLRERRRPLLPYQFRKLASEPGTMSGAIAPAG